MVRRYRYRCGAWRRLKESTGRSLPHCHGGCGNQDDHDQMDAGEHWRSSIIIENPKLWTPDSPTLYDIVLQAGDDRGQNLLRPAHDFARQSSASRSRVDFPERGTVFWRGALDQSFNPKGIYTAPTDAFLKHDMELAKAAGIQFLRIHIKATSRDASTGPTSSAC